MSCAVSFSLLLLLFEKDGCLISKAVQKICLLSKQISASVLAKGVSVFCLTPFSLKQTQLYVVSVFRLCLTCTS